MDHNIYCETFPIQFFVPALTHSAATLEKPIKPDLNILYIGKNFTRTFTSAE